MATVSDCDAVILAGGKATRLQSVVSDRPKILADICGRPFAHYLLNQLARAGFRRAVICTGHMADMVEETLGTRWGELELIYSREAEARDTGGAIRLALDKLATERAMVVNGDTFVGLDYADMLGRYVASKAAASLALVRVPDPSRYGSVHVAPSGLVERFIEKSPDLRNTPALINAGVYALARPLIEAIPPGRRVSVERELMPHWMKMGLLAYPCHGPFIDIGTPQSYDEAQTVLAQWAGN